MPRIFVSTDLHLWSKDDDEHRHPYLTQRQIDDLAARFASNMYEDDILIFLGDLCDPEVTDENKLAAFVRSIPGTKYICKGNHDIEEDSYYLAAGFDEVSDIIRMHNILFSHKPIKVAPDELNVHGHLHTRQLSGLSSQHINAYGMRWADEGPLLLLDDLISSATVQKLDISDQGRKNLMSEFELYTTLDGNKSNRILDISNTVTLDNTLSETASFSDVMTIINRIPANEHRFIYHGDVFKDSPYVKYRNVQYAPRTKGGAFIDVYALDDPKTGIVVIGAEPAARGTGLTDTLVKGAIANMDACGFTTLYWKCSKDNPHSLTLAQRNGFVLDKHETTAKEYVLKYTKPMNETVQYPRLRAEVKETTNPNDTQSQKAVDVTFYDGNRLIGTASASAINTDSAFLYNVEVVKDQRGKGYGKAIVNHMMTNYPITDLSIAPDNRIAIDMYEKFGFRKIKEFNDYDGTRYVFMQTIKRRGVNRAYLQESAVTELYHGSAERYPVLKAHVSPAYPDIKAVYATPMYGFALALAGGKWSDFEINQCMVDDTQVLTEMMPGMFNKYFNCSGYIYHLDTAGFQQLGHHRMEYVSNLDVTPLKVDHVMNVLDALRNDPNTKLYYYPDLPPHIPSRRAYIESRCKQYGRSYQRVSKMYPEGSLDESSDGLYADRHATSTEEKYGIRELGHVHEAEDKDKAAEKERELEKKQQQRKKQLAKARRAKKRKSITRKIKSHLPGVKNEEADTVDGKDAEYLTKKKDPVNDVMEGIDDGLVESFDYNTMKLIDRVQFADRLNETSNSDGKKFAPVYVVLIHGDSPISFAIDKLTNAEFTHASISFDASLRDMYSFSAKDKTKTISDLIGGFKHEDINGPYYKKREIPYAVYMVPATEDAARRMKKRLKYFADNETKFTFDYIGLIKNFFQVPDDPKCTWFCSRFVADILNAGSKSDNLIEHPSLYRPDDFKNAEFAYLVDKGIARDYNPANVERKTQVILRSNKIRNARLFESVGLSVCPDNPYETLVLEYQLSTMNEAGFDKFLQYIKSFKVRLDKDGNILITRREYDQLYSHFKESLRLIKTYEETGDVAGVKDELCKIKYMIELINQYYLREDTKNFRDTAKDVRKDMLDLRSVMMNAFRQHLKWVTLHDSKFNFQRYYDNHSKYGKNVTIPKKVVSDVGRVVLTALN